MTMQTPATDEIFALARSMRPKPNREEVSYDQYLEWNMERQSALRDINALMPLATLEQLHRIAVALEGMHNALAASAQQGAKP
jgi:hypothetical protein